MVSVTFPLGFLQKIESHLHLVFPLLLGEVEGFEVRSCHDKIDWQGCLSHEQSASHPAHKVALKVQTLVFGENDSAVGDQEAVS